MALVLPHSQFMSKASVAPSCANRDVKRLENLHGAIKLINQKK